MAPIIAGGGVAIAHVDGFRFRDDSLRFGARRGNHHVVSGEVERFEGVGTQSGEEFRMRADERDLLKETRFYEFFGIFSVRSEEFFEPFGEIYRRIYVGLGEKFEDVGEHLFRAAPIFEPIADDGDFFVRESWFDAGRVEGNRAVFG